MFGTVRNRRRSLSKKTRRLSSAATAPATPLSGRSMSRRYGTPGSSRMGTPGASRRGSPGASPAPGGVMMPVGEWNIRRTLEATVNENFELKEMAAHQGSQVEKLKAKLKTFTEPQQSMSPLMSKMSPERSTSPDTVQRMVQPSTHSGSPTVRSPSELSAALHGLERSRAALQRQKAIEVEQLQQQLAKAKGDVIKVRQSVQQSAAPRLVEKVSGAVLSGNYPEDQSRLTEELSNLPKSSMSARSKFGQIARKPPQPPRAHRHTPEASTEGRPHAKTTDDPELVTGEIEAPTEEAPARSFISWWGRSLFE